MMAEPQAAAVKAFWAHMQKEFGTSVVLKSSSDMMEVVGQFLDAIGIQDKETFLTRFTTTIGKTIYIPFEIGTPGEHYDLWRQLRVCVHEHQHVVQGGREGWATFSAQYVSSSSWRAGYEAEAYGSDLEMEYWKLGPGLDIESFILQRTQGLKAYGCSDEDILMAQAMLRVRADVTKTGAVETLAAQRAITWLEST